MYSFISRLHSIIDLCVCLHANTPGSSAGKRMHLQHGRPWFDSWVGKICWRRDRLPTTVFLGFPGGSPGKESACNVETWVRSLGWEDLWRRDGYPLQYSGLENLMDCIVHGKEMQKSKMAVWGGLTNSCEKKRGKKQRRKGKI